MYHYKVNHFHDLFPSPPFFFYPWVSQQARRKGGERREMAFFWGVGGRGDVTCFTFHFALESKKKGFPKNPHPLPFFYLFLNLERKKKKKN